MKRLIYLLIQFTWGLGQTAIGFLFFPILKGTKKYKDVKYTKCFVEYNASWLVEKVTGQKAVW